MLFCDGACMVCVSRSGDSVCYGISPFILFYVSSGAWTQVVRLLWQASLPTRAFSKERVRGWAYCLVIECLPGKQEALGSFPRHPSQHRQNFLRYNNYHSDIVDFHPLIYSSISIVSFAYPLVISVPLASVFEKNLGENITYELLEFLG